MINFDKISILDLLPQNFQDDPNIKASAEALNKQLDKITEKTKKISIYERLFMNQLSGEEVDELAYQFHVDFYDPAFPLSQRLELVKKAIPFHRLKGTAGAVEDLIKILFGDGEVEEWFQYGGEPGYYQVTTNNQAVTNEKAEEFIRSLRTVTRVSQHLQSVLISQIEKLTFHTGSYVHVGETIKIKGKR